MTHPLDIFDQIYVINLASRADRRTEMQEQLRRIGLSLQSPRVRLFEAVRPKDAGGFPSIGTRGCFLSHLGVLRHAEASGFERIAILEDDLNFSPDFMSRGAGLLAQLGQSDWAMFYGGYVIIAPERIAVGCSLISPDEPVGTTHFVALRGKTIACVERYLSAMLNRPPGDVKGGPMHVDGAYTWFRRSHTHLSTFIAVPELGYQRSSRTDIHGLRWYDRIPAMREGVAMLRRLKNRCEDL